MGGGINCHTFAFPIKRRIAFNGKNKKLNNDIFEKIISLENLFLAWREFKVGKSKKSDVQQFEFNLEDNLFQLHQELKDKTYQHSQYTAFNVCDPKLRRIHKAIIKDRVLHHAIFRILYPVFDKHFIFDSYSCRTGKGTHKAVNRLEKFAQKLSRNDTRNIRALKCDIRKFFDSVGQDILLKFIKRKISDPDAVWLIEKIIRSFARGIPLGNVTSQLFANIYLNELDQFTKHILRGKYYLRYCDDFIILGENENDLKILIPQISKFLEERLKLNLHPNKINIRKYRQGIDFLGYVVLPNHRALRTKTKRRMLRKIRKKKFEFEEGIVSEESFQNSIQSYLGILKHCRGRKIENIIEKIVAVYPEAKL